MMPASQPDPLTVQVNHQPLKLVGRLILGFVFFVATFVLAIVAMTTNQLGHGIALLVSSVGSSILCVIISLALLSNAFTAALKKERATRLAHATPRVQLHPAVSSETSQLQHPPTTETSLQDLLGPAKGSLVVNINTASAKELESLPNIGSSRAEQIIAHRPYASVDELSQVKGVTPFRR